MPEPSPYDVCIVGAGLAGALVASELADHGFSVVMFDGGRRFDPSLRFSLLQEDTAGRDPWRLVDPGPEIYASTGGYNYPLEGKRLRAVGGSTHHWGGVAYRMHSADFRLRTAYGIGEDWPISYEELEPFYAQAEREMGVAGAGGDPFASPRSTDYPLPAFPFSYADTTVVKPACDKLGIRIHQIPYARNSMPYQGRPACHAFGACHVCPIEAMYNADTHVRRAEKTGRVAVRDRCTVLRINPAPENRVESVTYADADGVRREQGARVFVLAAHTIESVRLLLLSRSPQHPAGLANANGVVGRFFMEHFATGMVGVVPQPLYPNRIGFNTAHSTQFYNTSERGHVGAMKLTFASGGFSPSELAQESPLWGQALKRRIRAEFGRSLAVVANVEQLPDADNSIGLDSRRRDGFGNPAPAIRLSVGSYERRTLRRARDIAVRILRSAGARIPLDQYMQYVTNECHPIAHHMGGCRMGTDPSRSVVDRNLKIHALENLFVAGSSVFPTGGAVNPSLTIGALALRLAEHLNAVLRTH